MIHVLLLTITITFALLSLLIIMIGQLKITEDAFRHKVKTSRGLKKRYFLTIIHLVEVSNIRYVLPFYDGRTHGLLSSICFGITFTYFSQKGNLFLGLMIGPVGFLLPSLVLKLMADSMEYKMKKYYPNFLITFHQFYRQENNIFEAFRRAAPFLVAPLKGYVDQAVDEYDDKIKPEVCLKNLRKRIHNIDVRTFFRGMEICFHRGGDVELLIVKSIQSLNHALSIEQKMEAEVAGLKLGMYLVLMANYALLNYMISGPYKVVILNNWWGNLGLGINIVSSVFVINGILKQGSDMEVKASTESY